MLLVLVAVLGCSRGPQLRSSPAAEVVLTVEGKVRGAPVEIDAAGLGNVDQRTLRGRDPRPGVPATYQGASLWALVRELEPRRGVDLAVVHGRGGYAVALPLPTVQQHRPVLAGRVDGRPVADALGAEAGPLVLAWPNVQAPGFDLDPRTRRWWPRGVSRMELVSWFDTYGRALRVPAGASDEARRGADQFATRCIQCHRLRGAGGEVGPDLSKGIEPAGRDGLFEAVRRHVAKMPELAGTDLSRGLPEVAAFLAAVESAGPAQPGDEPALDDRRDEDEEEQESPTLPPVMPPGPM